MSCKSRTNNAILNTDQRPINIGGRSFVVVVVVVDAFIEENGVFALFLLIFLDSHGIQLPCLAGSCFMFLAVVVIVVVIDKVLFSIPPTKIFRVF